MSSEYEGFKSKIQNYRFKITNLELCSGFLEIEASVLSFRT